MYRLRTTRFVAAVAAVVLMTAPAWAQETGVVRGSVTLEENGEPVHGAVILLVGSGAFTLTDEQGEFEIGSVTAGSYEVLAQREHLTASRQAITIVPGETATVEFELGLSPVHEHVTVTASATGTETAFEAFNAVTTLDSFDLARASSASLGEALQSEPGMASRSFGPGSSRPIIRGFDGDRVLILQDGVRTGDLSSQSADHGTSLDPNAAERIEIVRGPATLLYGSNAVGGVVNVITPHESYRDSLFDETRAQFSTNAGSANAQVGTNASLQHSRGSVLFWGGGSMRKTDDYQTPLGTVENSATELTNARAGLGWFGDQFFSSGGFTMEDARHGIPFAGEFHSAHDDDHAEEEDELDIDIDSRRRGARFDLGLRNLENRAIAGMLVSVNAIDWSHDELEILEGVESIGTRYTNRTYIVRADIDQQQTERLSGKFGVWTHFRDFEAVGAEALAPQTDHTSFAAFAYEELNLGRYRVQFGGRVEQNDYRTGQRAGALDHDHDADDDDDDDHAGEEEEAPLEAPDPRDRQFRGVSTSVGLHADLGADSAFVANLTHSYRAPALEELYNFGPHVGNLAFEVGNPNLDAETTLGLDVNLRHHAEWLRADAGIYYYDIRNFIFGDRIDDVVDNLRVLNFLQGDSRFLGFDAKGSIRLGGNAWATLGIGYVDARLTTTNKPLPRIPPLRGTVSLDIPYRGFTLSPQLAFAGRQGDVFRDETETAGYTIFNLRASHVWPRQHTAHILTFTGYNLTNALYRNHTSFIKDLAPEMGRGVSVSYSLRFF